MSVSRKVSSPESQSPKKRLVAWLAGLGLLTSSVVIGVPAAANDDPPSPPTEVSLTVTVVDETDGTDTPPGIQGAELRVWREGVGTNLCFTSGEDPVFTAANGVASCLVPANASLRFEILPPTDREDFLRPFSEALFTAEDDVSREVATIKAPSGSRSISGTLRSSSPSVVLGPDKNVNLLYNDDDYGFFSRDVFTDSAGNFSFGGLAPGKYVLQTNGDDHLYWFADVTLGSVDLVVNPNLLAPGTLVIQGNVFERGTEIPVEDVSVTAFLERDGSTQSSWGETVETDDTGSFVITGVPAGRIGLFISETPDGYFEQWADVTLNTRSGELEHTFFLDPLPTTRGGTISGVVSDDGSGVDDDIAAVEGATVYLSYSQGDRGYFKSEKTEADGSFSFEDLWAGQYWLWVNCDLPCSGLDSAWSSVRITDLANPTPRNFTLKTLPTGNNTLELTFEDQGGPISDLYVDVQNRSFTSIWEDGTTGADGKVSLTGLPTGSYSVWPQTYDQENDRPAFKSLPWGQEIVAVGEGTTEKTLRLERIDYANGSRVSGTVIDTRTGSPVAGANISLSTESISLNTIAGPDGSWEFATVPPGDDYFLFVGPPNFDDTVYEYVFRDVGTVPQNGDLTLNVETRSILPGTGSVTVTTRDKVNHRRISGETVFLNHATANYFEEGQTVNGTFVFSNLPPGTYYLQADSNEFLFDEGFEVEVGQTGNTNVTFRGESLSRIGTVSGKISDENGAGLQGAFVQIGVIATSEGEETPFSRWVSDLYAFTDDNGNYELTRVPVGREIEIEVDVSFGSAAGRPGGLVPFSERFTLNTDNPSATKNISMVPGGVIFGTVTVQGGSTPQGLWATAFDADSLNWLSSAPVLGDGTFSIERLRATTGDQRVIVLFEDFRRSGASIQNAFYAASGLSFTPGGAAKLQVTSGGTTTLDTRQLQLGGSIEGTVSVLIDGEDAELPRGRWVYVQVRDSDQAVVPFVGGYADGFSGGDYSIRGLAPGDYTLEFIDGLSLWGGFTTGTERRLYNTVTSTSLTVTAGGVTTYDQQMSTTRPQEVPKDVPVISALDADGDLEGGIGISSSLGIGAETSIELPSEMAGEWVLVVANSTPQFLTEQWVQVSADGSVTFTLPADLQGNHQIAVQDASEQLVGWSQVNISNNPAPSSRTSSKKAKAVPAEQIEEARQWMQNPVGPRPTVGVEPEMPEASEAEVEPPVVEPEADTTEDAPSAETEQATAQATDAGVGTLLWWVLGILVAIGAIAALVLIARRRLA